MIAAILGMKSIFYLPIDINCYNIWGITSMTMCAKGQRISRLCYLFLIFLVGSSVGWIYEEIFYWITEGLLRNRGVLYGPLLPIYGIGALGIYTLKPLKKHAAVLFFFSAVITGAVEGVVGFIGIRLFQMKLWDYSGEFANIGGIVCLRSVTTFAVGGLLLHYLVDPAVEQLVSRCGEKTVRAICLSLSFLLLADCFLSAFFRTPITY